MSNDDGKFDRFPPTQWSVVMSASDEDSAERSRALEQVCRTYWHPIYAYARKRGMSPPDAEDVTQGFLAHLVHTAALERVQEENGKLRTFLLVSVRNYMANEWVKRAAQKRGGGVAPLSIDVGEAEDQLCLEPADSLTPEAVYERHWATAMLQTVMARLEQVFANEGKGAQFSALREYMALGRGTRTYREVGEELGMSVAAVKVAVHRMRKRYRELLLEEISGTLEPWESAEGELRYLFGVFER